jgi:hypothetical protein
MVCLIVTLVFGIVPTPLIDRAIESSRFIVADARR